MGANSAIQWTDDTDNIITVVDGNGRAHGAWCRKISPGCAHCYSETLNQNSFFGGSHLKFSGKAPVLKLRENIIDGWARQTRPRKHFVSSTTDVFGEWVPQSWIFRFLDGMAAAPRQTFQVLTKRADVALREIAAWLAARGVDRLPSNIWIGASVEDQQRADERIPILLQIPARVRFLSVEPLLGPVTLSPKDKTVEVLSPWYTKTGFDPTGSQPKRDRADWLFPNISWVIVGGESGKGARPMHPAWALSVRDQCVAAGVPFFFKQWGGWLPQCNKPFQPRKYTFLNADGRISSDGEGVVTNSGWSGMGLVGKKAAGRLLDGRTWDEFPEVQP